MINYHLKPTVTEADAGPVYDAMHRLMGGLAGFRGLALLINEETHQAISLTYWQDQESARDAGDATLPHLMGQTQEFVEGPPEVSGFELFGQHISAT